MEKIMAQETIVFTQGGELPGDLLTQAQAMKPPGFTLHVLPADASAEDIASAMQEAEYLMGFVRFLPDEAYARASRLRLVQVLSAGYDRVNIAGARAARIPICSNGGANSVAVAEHTIMLILAVYRKLVTFHPNVAAGGNGRCGELACATQRRHATHDRCQGPDTHATQGDSDQYVSR